MTNTEPTLAEQIKYQQQLCENYQPNPVVYLIAKTILASLRRLQAIEQDGWIKCSERLPTDDSPVLVATQENVYRSFYYRDHWLMPSVGTVTHWRPLPPLPKE